MNSAKKKMYVYQHLQRGAKWFRYRVSIHHPLGFNWHPFEGAGTKYLFGVVHHLASKNVTWDDGKFLCPPCCSPCSTLALNGRKQPKKKNSPLEKVSWNWISPKVLKNSPPPFLQKTLEYDLNLLFQSFASKCAEVKVRQGTHGTHQRTGHFHQLP